MLDSSETELAIIAFNSVQLFSCARVVYVFSAGYSSSKLSGLPSPPPREKYNAASNNARIVDVVPCYSVHPAFAVSHIMEFRV